MSNQIKKILAPISVFAIGIILVIVGIVDISHAKNFPQTEAVVTDIDIVRTVDEDGTSTEEATVYVKYTVDGKEYNEMLSDPSNDLKEGDKIAVHYNPEKPSYVTVATKQSGKLRIVIG